MMVFVEKILPKNHTLEIATAIIYREIFTVNLKKKYKLTLLKLPVEICRFKRIAMSE